MTESELRQQMSGIVGKQFVAHLVKTDIQGRKFWEPRQEEVNEAVDQLLSLAQAYAQAHADYVIGEDEQVTGHVRANGLLNVDLTASYNNALREQQRLRNRQDSKGK